MKVHYILCIGLIIALAEAKGQQTLSLQQTKELAMQNNRQIMIAGKQQQKAKDERQAIFTNFLPKISASATTAYLNDDFETEIYIPTVAPNPLTGALEPNIMINPLTGQPVIGPDGNPVFNLYGYLPIELSIKGAYMAGINVEQPIFTGGKIYTAWKMSKIGESMAEQNLVLQQQEAIYEAIQTYWLYISVNEKVKLAQKAVDFLSQIVVKAQNAAKAGLATQNDVLKAEVERNNAKMNLQKAESGLELIRMSLCRITGLPFDSIISATDTIIAIETNAIPISGNNSIEQRPEYKLMEQSVKMEEQKINLARADFLPTAGISAGYQYLGGIEVMGNEMSQGNFSVMGKLSIPVFHWGEGYKKISSARRDAEIKQLEMEHNSNLMRLEVEQCRLNLSDSYTAVKIAEDALVQAEENRKLCTNAYESGMEDITALLMAQTQWQETYSKYIEAKADFKVKETAYQKSLGILQ